MKMVIEIPEDAKAIIDRKGTNETVAETLWQAVKNGKSLPKGHGRLIEVTPQLEQELFTFTRYTGIDECPYESATIVTDTAPTIVEADEEAEI